MTKDKYLQYGAGLAVGAALAIWLGVPPTFLLFLLVCPLMMFFMMRGMHGGQEEHDQNHTPGEHRAEDTQQSRGPTG